MGGYLEKVWNLLTRPEWMVDTGIPLLATLAGLAIALLVVRRQLIHDRELRIFDQRREAAVKYGRDLIEARDAFYNRDVKDSFWRSPSWEYSQLLRSGFYRGLKLHLSEAQTEDFFLVLSSIDAVWYVCHNQAAARNPDLVCHQSALLRCLSDYVAGLDKAGQTLMAWDGRSQLPALISLCPTERFHRLNPQKSDDIFVEMISAEYNRIVDDLEASPRMTAKWSGIKFLSTITSLD
ncbi:hypothetical protein ACQ856_30285 (plasmid) [Mycolicibacterium psychrotolerans]|uniref:hypothetical protein n=1 Tax=Mycolicibacterium psychrotolerans TaxID=216929 RepID=UPI003D66EAA9